MEIWTPKNLRSREKWRKHLVEFQYNNQMSQQEMDEYFRKVAEGNILGSDETNKKPTTIYNSADLVLNYLIPKKKK